HQCRWTFAPRFPAATPAYRRRPAAGPNFPPGTTTASATRVTLRRDRSGQAGQRIGAGEGRVVPGERARPARAGGARLEPDGDAAVAGALHPSVPVLDVRDVVPRPPRALHSGLLLRLRGLRHLDGHWSGLGCRLEQRRLEQRRLEQRGWRVVGETGEG